MISSKYSIFSFQTVLLLKKGSKGDDQSSGTLQGNKKLVYVLAKILKKCTAEDMSSYDIKYAVSRSISAKKYETEPVGSSLQRVLR